MGPDRFRAGAMTLPAHRPRLKLLFDLKSAPQGPRKALQPAECANHFTIQPLHAKPRA